jgi:hypothetical protein
MTLLKIRAVAIVVCFSIFSSCSLRLNEPLEEPQTFSVKIPGQDCLGESGTFWKQYFEGKSSSFDVENYQICLKKALKAFLDSTKGANPDLYTPQELAGFTQKYFFENKKIPDSLILESMKLKTAIFGGSSKHISRAEIEVFLNLLPSLSEVAKKLLPFMPIDSQKLLNAPNPDQEISEAIKSIKTVSVLINQIFKQSYSEYSTSNLQNLFLELEKMYQTFGWDLPWNKDAKKWLTPAPTFKKLLTNSNSEIITSSEWPKIVSALPEIYEIYLRRKLVDFQDSRSDLDNLAQLTKIFRLARNLLQERETTSEALFFTGELNQLLETFFSSENKPLNSTLAKNISILKKSFVGGSEEYVSYSELTKLFNNFEVIGNSITTLFPLLPLNEKILLNVENDSQLRDKLDPIFEAGKQIAQNSKLGSAPYKIEDFQSLLTDLEQLAKSQNWDVKSIQKLKNDLPILFSTKALIFQSNSNLIYPSDIRELGNLGPVYVLNYLRFQLAKKANQQNYLNHPILITAASDLHQSISLAQKSNEAFQGVSSRELQQLLNYFLFSPNSVRQEFFEKLFQLKVGLVGGASSVVSGLDSQRLALIARDWIDSYQRISRFLPINTKKLIDDAQSDQALKENIQQIQEALKIATISFSGEGYSFSQLQALLDETESLFSLLGWNLNTVRSLKEITPVLEKSSELLLSKKELSGADWKQLNHLGTEVFGLYLRWSKHLKAKELLKGKSVLTTAVLTEETNSFLENALNARRGNPFQEAEISLALDLAKDTLPYSKSSIISALRVINKYFVPGEKRSDRVVIGYKNLGEFRAIYSYYFDGLLATQGIFVKTFGKTKYENSFLTRKKASSLIRSVGEEFAFFKNASTEISIKDLNDSILNIDVFFHPGKERVIVPKQGEGEISYYHLSQMHLLKTVNKMLLRAFGNQKKGLITENQTIKMFNELKPLFQLFSIDVSDLIPAIPSRFFEASLFLPHSDGKIEMNMNEAIEIESLFLSVIDQAKEIHTEIALKCKSPRSQTIPYECFLKAFAMNTNRYWQGIPNFQRIVGALPVAEKISLLKDIDQFLRRERSGDSFTETDIRSLLQVTYYIELLLYRFDFNKDGYIDQNEAKKGFPLFRSFIAKKAEELGRSDPNEHFKIFTYILAKQKVPATFFEKLDYLNWKADSPFAVDRLGVIRIFSTLLSF